MAALIDTNILVYAFDPSEPRKQRMAVELLEVRLRDDSARIAHQAIVEFVAATTRPRGRGRAAGLPLLALETACREAEEFLSLFEILYPTEALVRTPVRGAVTYQLSLYDAHMWAYAEHYGLSELVSEDFAHGRLYGTVLTMNPFLTWSDLVRQGRRPARLLGRETLLPNWAGSILYSRNSGISAFSPVYANKPPISVPRPRL